MYLLVKSFDSNVTKITLPIHITAFCPTELHVLAQPIFSLLENKRVICRQNHKLNYLSSIESAQPSTQISCVAARNDKPKKIAVRT